MINVIQVDDFEKFTEKLDNIASAIENMPTPSGDDISEMTWTELVQTTTTSTPIAIPAGTKYLVLTAELENTVSLVTVETVKNLQKLLTVSGKTTCSKGYEYSDTAGNHTFIAMSINNDMVTISSGYATVTAKLYYLT